MTRPLQGCRVLDLGIITAGAATSALLADLGAEVIKIEAPAYHDPFRDWTPPPGLAPGTMAPFFRYTNRNKLGLGLDLKQESGRDAFLRLVEQSHVVVENFRRGVLGRLGIGFASLVARNDRIILASISSQGETGPMTQYVSFGTTLEAVGGLAAISGEPGGAPVVSGKEVNLPDQLVAIFAASMIATAWLARRDGNCGPIHLDLAQRELTSFMLGEQFAAANPGRTGNAQAPYALQDCIATADGWLAISVLPNQAAALQALVGAGGLADWCAVRSGAACAEVLAGAGIAASPVLDGAAVLAARGSTWSEAVTEHPDYGLLKGFPFQLEQAPLRIDRDAPALGADTAVVLADVAGMSESEIEALLSSYPVSAASAD